MDFKTQDAKLTDLALYSGYSHIGSCREFHWLPPKNPGKEGPRFVIRGLKCSYEVEALMIRKDLYLRCDSGKEYVVSNFQITDIEDVENIAGSADRLDMLFEKFPEMKTITEGEKVLVSKQTQVMAFKAVTNMINSVRVGQGIDSKGAKETVVQMVEEISQNPGAVMNLIDIKSFDDYTFTHNINVATLSVLIGQEMGLADKDLNELGTGALLHDLGKLKVSLAILNKDGKLTNEEFAEMKKHPLLGYEILQLSEEISQRSKLVALQHHEKFQGRGYPNGLRGNDISLFGRICAVADVYDALTTDRPYRVAMTPYDAVKIVMSGIDSQFDPQVLQAFLKRFSIHPSGSLVHLSDGGVALVLRTNPKSVLRPVVKILKDAAGQKVTERVEIDLMTVTNLFIRGPADLAALNVKAAGL